LLILQAFPTQLGAADGMQGNPAANNVKWGLRALSVVLIPLTASFPQVYRPVETPAPSASASDARVCT
jgi:hypothetical protein